MLAIAALLATHRKKKPIKRMFGHGCRQTLGPAMPVTRDIALARDVTASLSASLSDVPETVGSVAVRTTVVAAASCG